MSDQELPAHARPESVHLSDSAALNYAFLVHSQKSLTQNLPPRVDNKLLARQKRRRTSPEDQAILEGEYQRNPKPDKATRASIVSRVSLGEKEVQIWFQNRRQNDRRKSKPLQPHELIALQPGLEETLKRTSSDDNLPADPGSSSGPDQPDDENQGTKHTTDPLDVGGSQSSLRSDAVLENKDEQGHFISSQTSMATEPLENSQGLLNEAGPKQEGEQNCEFVHPGGSHMYAAKRKRGLSDVHGDRSIVQGISGNAKPLETNSPPSLRLSLSFDGEALVRKKGELTPSPPKGRNALRIAMSSDGEAVVRAENEPSPSKSRISMSSARKPRAPGLRRSSSAVVLGGLRNPATAKDRIFGRSRDPRNWESFVDTDARSALTPSSSQGAPNTDSPGLFRSRNQRPLSRSLSARQNSLGGSSDRLNPPIAQQMGEKRRKLSRTVSSLGRLETGRNMPANRPSAHPLKSSKMPSNGKAGGEDLDPDDGDSDKENWIPGTRTSRVHRRATHNAQRPVLKDASNRDGGAKRNIGAVSSGKFSRANQGSQRKSHGGFGADASAFMAGGSGPSQEEDLDCIQGLLSLSQGAWR